MSEPKTRPTTASVPAFLAGITNEQRLADGEAVLKMMREVSGEAPVMWGDAIVGFGSKPMRNADGTEVDWPAVGFSPRKRELVVYIMSGFGQHTALLAKLGKHKIGQSCLYIKRLSDVDQGVLRELVAQTLR